MNNQLKVLDFQAKWCGPCKSVAPMVKKVVAEFENIQLIEIDVDEETDKAMEYGIRSVPTFILLKNDQVVDRLIGAVPAKDFKEFLTKNM